MKLAFSTLGCPDWELDTVVEAARRHGYEAVELRALGGSLDLLGRPEFRPEAVAATRARLSAAGLSVCCVDSSCSFDSADAGERARQIELAAQHCELAAELAAPPGVRTSAAGDLALLIRNPHPVAVALAESL